MVKTEQIYSPQNYLELITGKCYIVDGDNDIEFIEKILKEHGYCRLRNYSMSEIECISSKDIGVVLVDCMVYNEESQSMISAAFEHVYRWFEVPSDIFELKEEETKETQKGTVNRYFFDVTEFFTKTIAIEAETLEQAKKRIAAAHSRKEFEVNRKCPDDIEFKYAQKEVESCIKEGFFDEEELEIFNCCDVVYDAEQQMFVCPVCGNPIADKWTIKDVDYILPKRCSDCHAKLKY